MSYHFSAATTREAIALARAAGEAAANAAIVKSAVDETDGASTFSGKHGRWRALVTPRPHAITAILHPRWPSLQRKRSDSHAVAIGTLQRPHRASPHSP